MVKNLVYDDIDEEALNAPPRRRRATTAKNPNAKADYAIPEMVLPRRGEDVVNNLVVRELVSPSGEIEKVSNTVHLYGALMNAISRGEEIGPMRDEIKRITQNQPEKADALLSVLSLIDQERTGDFVEMRAKSEKVIKRAVARGDLTTSEALTVWQMSSKVIAENQVKLTKNVKAVEEGVVDKVDYFSQQQDRKIAKRWEGTSPQGREIMRKKLYALKRRISEITVEEEIVEETTETASDATVDV